MPPGLLSSEFDVSSC